MILTQTRPWMQNATASESRTTIARRTATASPFTGAILEGTLVVRVPVYIMEEVMRVKRMTRQLYQELGREPTPEIIGQRLGMTAERVSELLIWAEKVFSLDAPLSEEEENTLGDVIEDVRERGPME